MNKTIFDQYLREYVREALIFSDNDVEGAANYLLAQKKPKFLAKQEKKQALERAQKIFSAYSDRPLWFVLKCIGVSEEELNQG
jgi:hypothetical protein